MQELKFKSSIVSNSQAVINRYCWIMSTFTLPKHYEGTIGDEFLHFGVGKTIFFDYLNRAKKSPTT